MGDAGLCILQTVAGCQVATGAGSISASPADAPGTSSPCLGGKGGLDKAQGCSHTPSSGRVPKGALGHGRETGPVVMLVPAQGALQPVGGRLRITVIASSCSRSVGLCHGIAPSGQAAGDKGQLFWAAQGTPAVMLSVAQCAGAGTWVLPSSALCKVDMLPTRVPAPCCPPHLGESHIPWMRQPRAGLTWVMLNPSRWLCASQTGVTRAEGGTTASGPEAKV